MKRQERILADYAERARIETLLAEVMQPGWYYHNIIAALAAVLARMAMQAGAALGKYKKEG